MIQNSKDTKEYVVKNFLPCALTLSYPSSVSRGTSSWVLSQAYFMRSQPI